MITRAGEESDAQRSFALEVVRTLRGAGFQALWAGGCVRDLLLGKRPSDYDVATDAAPDVVRRLFRRSIPVGISFGVVRVLDGQGGDVEVATFRSDGRYLDGRRPEAVRFGSAREDALRRDFTINGMFLDPLTGNVLDHVGGRADLAAGLVRAIGDPELRFSEDKLRLLRAVRFTATLGFQLDEATARAVRKMAGEVTVVSAERIAAELRRLLVHASRATGVRLLVESRLMAAIIPPVAELFASTSCVDPSHEDGDDQSGRTLRALAALRAEPEPSFPLALAVLLHALRESPDSSCASPRIDLRSAVGPEGVSVDEVGRRAADRIAASLKLSNDERSRVGWLVAHRELLNRFERLRPSGRKRLAARAEFFELVELRRCLDEAADVPTERLGPILDYPRALPEGPLEPPPLVGGDDLLALGFPRGPSFKRALDAARDAQLDGLVHSREEALELAVGRLERPQG